MKKALKIVWHTVLGVLLLLYVTVAAVNYSVVQSYLGVLAGKHFSKEWGGEIKIGSLHAMPWDHLILDNVLLVSPTNDTIFRGESVRVSFERFPFRKSDGQSGLELSHVIVRNAYYHLAIEPADDGDHRKNKINLNFIIDHYKKDRPRKKHGKMFVVDARSLTLDNVHYKMDLPDKRHRHYAHGVEIPHMEFANISGRFRDIHVEGPDVTARIIRLATTERSGFVVSNVTGNVHVSPQEIVVEGFSVETPRSNIVAEVAMHYPNWMKDYLHEVEHDLQLAEGTTVAMSDVAYWAPALWGIEMKIDGHGHAYGRIDSLVADGMHLDYGSATSVNAEGRIVGLPDIPNTLIAFDHLSARTSEADIDLLAAGWPGIVPEAVVRQLKDLGHIDLALSGSSTLRGEGTLNADIACDIGNLRADIASHLREDGSRRATVDLNSDGLGLSLLHSDWLTRSGLALTADVVVPEQTSDLAAIEGNATIELTNSVVKGHRVAPVAIEGTMRNGLLNVDIISTDSLLNLAANVGVQLADSIRSYSADIDIKHIDGYKFGLLPEKIPTLHTHLVAALRGNGLDDLCGTVEANGTEIGQAKVSSIDLRVDEVGHRKEVRLESDPITIAIDGQFAYADLPVVGRHILSQIVPDGLLAQKPLDEGELSQATAASLNLAATWNDRGHILPALGSNIGIAQGTRISANYDGAEMLKVALRSDSLRVGSILLEGIGLSGHSERSAYILAAEVQEAGLGSLQLMPHTDLLLNSNSQRALVELEWGAESPTRGDIMLALRDGKVTVMKPNFFVADTEWTVAIDDMHIGLDPTAIVEAQGISIRNDEQQISADISISHHDSDNITLHFDKFRLGPIADILLHVPNVSLQGDANGRFALHGLNADPYFNANLTIADSRLNKQSLGDIKVVSSWNAELNILNLQLNSEQVAAHGWLGLGKKDVDLNFAVDFDSLNLALAAPFMSTFSQRFEGLLHGSFDIGGTISHPVVVGDALIEDGALHVDITGVTYYFSDSLTFVGNKIMLDHFKILDPLGNLAYADGELRYNSIDDFFLDLDINTDNLLLLDKESGDQFYGRLLASASGNVGGSVKDISVAVSARTNPGSTLTVPVTDQRQGKTQNYIVFVGDETDNNRSAARRSKSESKYDIELDLSITPDVLLNLPITIPNIEIRMGGSGSGDLHLSLDQNGMPQVMGSYEIVNGTMKMSLLSLATKNFTIEPGSNLTLQGDLPDARFDVRAVYSQRVNMSTLTGSLSTVDNTQKYLQVENVIAVSGTLQEPSIGFDIRLPGADQSVVDEVFAYIDRNSERDMINQTVSLLLSGNFYNVSGNDQNTSATATGIGTIASTLGGIVADMVNIVDINIDYRAATDLTNDQLNFNISKDWGRWYLESTLGYGGESRELESSATGGTVLDALVGYRINPLIHLYAYNRTNTNDYTRIDLPYKQGIGLKLTKDFDHWYDLIRFNRTKKKNATTNRKASK